ncbi:hypothetical protein, partial [Klebsiella pneumoniae]|uniref:hypothetical protein n=1 Tax=Klebsiella pneumoniae TaxID=573 RepID=UPI0034D96821
MHNIKYNSRVKTISSFFIHGALPCDTLYIDECLMSHPGAIVGIISKVNPKNVVMAGDVLQIPFIPRVPG